MIEDFSAMLSAMEMAVAHVCLCPTCLAVWIPPACLRPRTCPVWCHLRFQYLLACHQGCITNAGVSRVGRYPAADDVLHFHPFQALVPLQTSPHHALGTLLAHLCHWVGFLQSSGDAQQGHRVAISSGLPTLWSVWLQASHMVLGHRSRMDKGILAICNVVWLRSLLSPHHPGLCRWTVKEHNFTSCWLCS